MIGQGIEVASYHDEHGEEWEGISWEQLQKGMGYIFWSVAVPSIIAILAKVVTGEDFEIEFSKPNRE